MDGNALVSPPYVAGPLRLEPFRALQLDPSKVGDPASARLYARPYRAVGTRVRSWIARGDIVEDGASALYLHEYADDGVTVRGVVGALDLTQRTRDPRLAAVIPHEGVHPVQAHDLAKRMREMKLNPAPILLAQRSPSEARSLLRTVREQLPVRQYLDRGGQLHRIWAIREPAMVDALNTAWGPTRALIADGHHRYAAYLKARAARRDGPPELGLAMLVDEDDTPLRLAAIHRTLSETSMAAVRAAARSTGLPMGPEESRNEALSALGPDTIVVTDGRAWATIALGYRSEALAVEQVDGQLIPALRRAPRHIHYEHSLGAALARTRRTGTVALILPAMSIEQVWQVVDAGRLLPEKATSFQPKPHAGVFMRSTLDAQPVH